MKMWDEETILKKLGLDFQMPDSGCCGMAGAFGFEEEHYPISLQVGERVLLPAVRAAAKETLIIADGFSCREQIAQTTDRQALHLAQVLQMALQGRQQASPTAYPEEDYTYSNAEKAGQSLTQLVKPALLGGLLVGGSVLAWIWRKRS